MNTYRHVVSGLRDERMTGDSPLRPKTWCPMHTAEACQDTRKQDLCDVQGRNKEEPVCMEGERWKDSTPDATGPGRGLATWAPTSFHAFFGSYLLTGSPPRHHVDKRNSVLIRSLSLDRFPHAGIRANFLTSRSSFVDGVNDLACSRTRRRTGSHNAGR